MSLSYSNNSDDAFNNSNDSSNNVILKDDDDDDVDDVEIRNSGEKDEKEFLMFVSFVELAARRKCHGSFVPQYDKLVKELQKQLKECSRNSTAISATKSEPCNNYATIFQRWIQAASLTVASLGKGCSFLVELLVSIDFVKYKLEDDYADMLENLVSAQPCHVITCLSSLIERFVDHGYASSSFDAIHVLIQSVIDINPSAIMQIGPLLREKMPHHRMEKSVLASFMANILQMIDYLPVMTQLILELCINTLIALDVEIQVILDGLSDEELEKVQFMDEEEDCEGDCEGEYEGEQEEYQGEQEQEVDSIELSEIRASTEKLDLLMFEMFSFLSSRYRLSSLDLNSNERLVEMQKAVFLTLLRVFERMLLRTFQSRYTQFLVFYFCALKPNEFPDLFLGILTSKLFQYNVETDQDESLLSSKNEFFLSSKDETSKNESLLFSSRSKFISSSNPIAISAVSYLASFLSRAKFISNSTFLYHYENLVLWAEWYISPAANNNLSDIRDDDGDYGTKHLLFYSVCQALFYVFCFRHEEILSSNECIAGMAGTGDNNLSLKVNNSSNNGNCLRSSYASIVSRKISNRKLQSIFERIISCPLNPLKVCIPSVVEEFASISAKYNFVYCFGIIESCHYNGNQSNEMKYEMKHESKTELLKTELLKTELLKTESKTELKRCNVNQINNILSNSNNIAKSYLESFFPFDPYHLKKSRKFIIDNDIYVDWRREEEEEDYGKEVEQEKVVDYDNQGEIFLESQNSQFNNYRNDDEQEDNDSLIESLPEEEEEDSDTNGDILFGVKSHQQKRISSRSSSPINHHHHPYKSSQMDITPKLLFRRKLSLEDNGGKEIVGIMLER